MYLLPKNFPIVFAFAGDSTITRVSGIAVPPVGQSSFSRTLHASSAYILPGNCFIIPKNCSSVKHEFNSPMGMPSVSHSSSNESSPFLSAAQTLCWGFVRDESGKKVAAVLAINYDITSLVLAEGVLKEMTFVPDGGGQPEKIVQNVNDLLDELLRQSVELTGKPVALMTKEDKVKALHFLNDAGAFLITKSSEKVCKFFGITKYALYHSIDIKGQSGNA